MYFQVCSNSAYPQHSCERNRTIGPPVLTQSYHYTVSLYKYRLQTHENMRILLAYLRHIMKKPVCHMRTNNKGADQPAHPRSLISTFMVRCLEGIITLVSISKISRS